MIDPIGASARAAADYLASEYGPEVRADVESVLQERASSGEPEQFFDPISLGALIVSVATLAWNIYSDLKKNKGPEVAYDVLREKMQAEVKSYYDPEGFEERDEIAGVVVAAILQFTGRKADG